MIERIILLAVLLAIIAAWLMAYNAVNKTNTKDCHCAITGEKGEINLKKEIPVVSKKVIRTEKEVLVDKKTKPKRKYKPRVSKKAEIEVPKN